MIVWIKFYCTIFYFDSVVDQSEEEEMNELDFICQFMNHMIDEICLGNTCLRDLEHVQMLSRQILYY